MNPPPVNPLSSATVSRRQFVAAAVTCATAATVMGAEGPAEAVNPELGPILGHTEADRCVIWMRVRQPGNYVLELLPESGGDATRVEQTAMEELDLCLHWKVEGLKADTRYRYRILSNGKPVKEGGGQAFTTPQAPEKPGKVRFAISSCAREDAGSRDVWTRIAAEKVDAVMLLGDTPYIDSTKLDVQMKRHSEFAAVEEYQSLLQGTPCWWTWDDHDFAANDSDGRVTGKENSRTAYCRHRPQWSHGHDDQGIYTSFRRGPVEVFVLDARWFSRTEPSPVDPAQPSLLGAKQWEWVKQGLKNSTAPFKFLACGMIWDDKENRESDDWGTYMHERRALEQWIAEHRISGVVLMGGDIHASRVLSYKGTEKTAGYRMVQFIASPIHHKVIPSLNVYHPDLVRSAVEPHVFLVVEVDSTVTPASLHAELVNRHGARVFTYDLTLDDLTPA
ncbi:alkaline phosphatase D family protein [Luteolibacter sp. SL250]|uniref:alkaline phosphatase D family protein n=1 Tax=Luteolibacter sp. SL250 TaxID=2995170 RepID=UPI002270CEDB|nr:alkaline phosphatase D family protein [Luteolibacter sp. SL250]WAC18734.1 alkaline phosphatase D family protein [Luteolibacter sp. SL250]